MSLVRIEGEIQEGSDFWVEAAVTRRREGFTNEFLLTTSDVSGLIALAIFDTSSSTPVYSTTFAKTLVQGDRVLAAIHAASVWPLDSIGFNFQHLIRQADVGADVLLGDRRYTAIYRIPTAFDGTVKVIAEFEVEALPGAGGEVL